MKTLQKYGAFASFYLAGAYLIGIIIFLVVLDYPSISDPVMKLAVLIEHQSVIFWTNILMYVVFGLVLVVFALALYDHRKKTAPALALVATVVAVVWAGSLVASGMVANAGIAPVLTVYTDDPAQAAVLWQTFETVASGLGNGNGEILGGVWTLLISLAALTDNNYPKLLGVLGIIVGSVGIVSLLPGMAALAGLFGVSQIIWFVWSGINLLRRTV
jgi:hypothetical protein